MSNRLLHVAMLFLFTLPAHSEIFKWVDEQGNTHYGDKPVGEQAATQLNIAEPENKKPAGSNTDSDQLSRAERSRRLAEAMQEDRLKKKEEKAKSLQEKQQLNQQCVHARDRLRQAEDAGRMYQLDKDGNRNFMSDEQRVVSIEKYRAEIKAHCGK